MATKKSQRIGIWIIAITMVVGTLGGFLVMILAPKNEAADTERITKLQEEYSTAYEAYQKKVDAQAAELSTKYYDTFKQYASRAAKFDASSVTELKTEDLKVGDGDTLTEESSFSAYYIGWKPDGTIFDQSISDGALSSPISAAPGGVIEGWTKGASGMKVGGIRELTIPSDLAYGEAGSGENIPANTPLKFVIFVIPTPEEIPQPEMSEELSKYYQELYGY